MASTTIQPVASISARIDKTGGRSARVVVTGTGSATITFTLDWNDNPNTNGDAINSISLNGMFFNSPGENGSRTRSAVFTPGNYPIDFNGLIQDIVVPTNRKIEMRDNDGNDANATFTLDSVVEIPIPAFTLSATISATPQTMTGTNVHALTWNTSNATSVTINSSAVSATGNRTENTNLQSVAGSLSPATKSYTITACASGAGYSTTCVSESVTVYVYNDGNPNSYSLPSTTTSGVSLSNLEPNTQYIMYVGVITGIDITIYAVTPAGVEASTNQVNWSSNLPITNNTPLYLRFTSPAFNTDPNGLTNKVSYYVDVGPIRRYFDVTTRAPNINELFDFGDNQFVFPYPKIDVTSTTVSQYTSSPTTLVIDNVELSNPYGAELKTDTAESQIRVKRAGSSTFGSWISTRQGVIKIPFGSLKTRTITTSNPTPTQFNIRPSGVITSVNAIA